MMSCEPITLSQGRNCGPCPITVSGDGHPEHPWLYLGRARGPVFFQEPPHPDLDSPADPTWSVTALAQTPGHDKRVWALQSGRIILSQMGAGGHWGHPIPPRPLPCSRARRAPGTASIKPPSRASSLGALPV